MNNSLISSLVGMQSTQRQIDTIANNLANIETTGFKSKEVYFSDIMSKKMNQPAEFNLEGRKTELGLPQGFGMKNSAMITNFSQGSKKTTGIDTDFMIQGEQLFFTILAPNGDSGEQKDLRYTKDGHFQLDANRYLVTDTGDFVLNSDGDTIQIPEGAKFSVSSRGRIIASHTNGDVEELGFMNVTRVLNPQILEGVGNDQYKIPDILLANDEMELIDAEFSLEDEGNGNYAVFQGSLENSNINLTKEMVKLTEAQRAYQLLSDGLSISNQMMNIAAKLRG